MDNENSKTVSDKKNAKSGKVIPALCNVAGTLILLAVIGAALIVVLPRLFGLTAYNITSGSMAPTIPIGSIVYVKSLTEGELSDVAEDEILAYIRDDSVIVHRVVSNRSVEGRFVTKGDHNESNDVLEVPYESVIGVVKKHFRFLGNLMTIYTSTAGKINLFIFAVCGALLNIMAARLRN